jgi:putative membrane protein
MAHNVDRDNVEKLVKEIELKTAAEIVPCLVDWSDNYPAARYRTALIGALIFYAITLFFNYTMHFELPMVLSLGLGYGLGFLISPLAAIRRCMISDAELDEESQQKALEVFFKQGIHATTDRLGVLIYIAWQEHRIHIIADDGLKAKINKEQWERIIAMFVLELKKGKVEAAMHGLLNSCGDLLAANFPRKSDDNNQLKDHLHESKH